MRESATAFSRPRQQTEPECGNRGRFSTMRLPPHLLMVVAFTSAPFAPSPLAGQARIDEGTFVFLKGGTPARTETFRISRNRDVITATAQVRAGTQQIRSTLVTDSVGTPAQYELVVSEKGAEVAKLNAMARGGRLTSMASSRTGDESMREYPLTAGKTLLLEPGLLHLLYFVPLGKSPGSFQLIEPRSARTVSGSLSAKGSESIQVAGKAVTGTHYTLAVGSGRYEFWVDNMGRLLRVESADGFSATREDLPR
jgi:hypothetical protein